jgi:hypothetical protein
MQFLKLDGFVKKPICLVRINIYAALHPSLLQQTLNLSLKGKTNGRCQ